MKIAVCAKQIPAPDSPQGFDPLTKTLLRSGSLVLDESDLYSVEIALRLVEQSGGGEVVLVSMVPGGETNWLRTALAMGATRALLVSDPALAGSDALGTARVLAAAMRREQPDLVLSAVESTDGYTGTVPVQLAELLDYPAVTQVTRMDMDGRAVAVRRQTDWGYDEVHCPLPAVVSVTAGVVDVRYPSLRGIMAAKSKPIEVLDLAALGVDPARVGQRGSGQEILSIDKVPEAGAGTVVVDSGQGHQLIVEMLQSWEVL